MSLQCGDFSWELLKHVQFALSCWNHLCLCPVANKIIVLSSIKENNSENTTFKWSFATASSFMPAWRASKLNLDFSGFPFFPLFYPQVFPNFLVPNIHVQPKDPVFGSCLPDVLMTFKHWTIFLCYQHGFPARVWTAWLELFHKPHISLFPWDSWICRAMCFHTKG